MLKELIEEITQRPIDLMTVKLNNYQKMVMAKIISAVTPKVAHDTVTIGRKMVTAVKQLKLLKLIEVGKGKALVTDIGKTFAQQINLTDESDGLTDEGEKWAFASITEDSIPVIQQAEKDSVISAKELMIEQYAIGVVTELETMVNNKLSPFNQDVVFEIVEQAFNTLQEFGEVFNNYNTAKVILNSNVLNG